MAVLAIKTSSYRNAVSRLHRQVSQEMWHDLWPQLPVWEVPITSITNGVHLPSWLNGDLAAALRSVPAAGLARALQRSRHLGAGRRHSRRGTAGSAPPAQAPPDRLSSASAPACLGRCAARPPRSKSARSRRSARSRTPSPSASPAASPPISAPRCCSAMSSGSSASCCNNDMPVQIVIAGKAHPKDQPGKTLHPRDRAAFARSRTLEARRLRRRLRHEGGARDGAGRGSLAQHAAPRRRSLRHQRHEGRHQRRAEPQHSGRLVRRSLRRSPAAGPSATASPTPRTRTTLHASAIYSLLENEIVPMFYERREEDAPRMDAAREAVAHAPQPALRLPPHGARVHDRALRTGPLAATCACARAITP